MIINNRFVTNAGKVQQGSVQKSVRKNSGNVSDKSFSDILTEEISSKSRVKFSQHAKMHLENRNISLTENQINRLNLAVEKAEKKGIRDSLIVVDDIALVVSVKNRTVITAADSKDLKDNVFTNIDGAVFS